MYDMEKLKREWNHQNYVYKLVFSVEELIDLDFVWKKINEIYDKKIQKGVFEDYKKYHKDLINNLVVCHDCLDKDSLLYDGINNELYESYLKKEESL